MTRTHALGQNFLIDPRAIATIVTTFLDGQQRHAGTHAFDRVFEIGPGQGALTQHLLAANLFRECILFEEDALLVPKLHQTWVSPRSLAAPTHATRVRIEEGDFLHSQWRDLLPATVLSNLPYSAGTRILVELTERAGPELPWMVLMFQKEVADRILSGPSTPDRGSLSVWIQNRWEVKRVMDLPPQAFRPAPKVDSTVLQFIFRPEVLFAGTKPGTAEAAQFEQLLGAAFLHRRKMLRKNLGALAGGTEALAASSVDETLRAEALSNEQWQALWNAYRALEQQRKPML